MKTVTITKDQLDFDTYKKLYYSIRWLKGCASKEESRQNLHALLKESGRIVATDSFKIVVWQPDEERSPLNLIPDGLWQVATCNASLIVLQGVDGEYPDVVDELLQPERTTAIKNIDSDEVRVRFAFSPEHITDICDKRMFYSAVCLMSKNMLHFELKPCEIVDGDRYYGVLMLMSLDDNRRGVELEEVKNEQSPSVN